VDFDLATTLRSLATRNPGRTEADIQAMARDVLVYGGFDLGDDTVLLESPAEDRRRLDIAVGAVIIECKRDLRAPTQLAKAAAQLGEYLAAKASQGTYAGLLTDGPIWRLYRHTTSGLVLVDELVVNPSRLDERAFRWWLGAVLSTEVQIQPTVKAIEELLGSGAPSFRLLYAALLDCWRSAEQIPAVVLKRQLWAKLLRSALGSQFADTDELFVEHTYLVLLATLIGHAVVGFDLNAARNDPGVLLSGQLFERAGILGVGQAGFFDWVLDSPLGGDVVSDTARRVASFEWTDVDHDVLKALYQSVIAPEVRKRLGEYYTPDWLAKRMVGEVVNDPLNQRVLDPACGSGTFLFHAIRRLLSAADEANLPIADALRLVTTSVFGLDLHPVAVALAQTTYLLAIGRERLAKRDQTLSIPVYLGDSMRWEAADESVFTSAGDVVLNTSDGVDLFDSELRFPAQVIADVGRFDRLVSDLSERATDRKPRSPRSKIAGLLTHLGVSEADSPTIEATYSVLCDLYDQGRNHIWGYYIRNQSRPTWLSRPENRVDVLIGNPPWLAFRFMSSNLQKVFQRRAKERGLWMGGARGRTTQVDLSAFFVARSIELYLRLDGRFGFVMPRAVLSRQTYGGFRSAQFSSAAETCSVRFTTAWDLEKVEPDPFPVPSSVIFGTRTKNPKPLSATVQAWSGRAPEHRADAGTFSTVAKNVAAVTGDEVSSAYKERFRDGAILYPRMLIMVADAIASPLGVPHGRRAVQSRKSSLDKKPWKELPLLEGVVEDIFIRSALLGESIAPFRILSSGLAIIPYDGTRLMDGVDDRIDRYSGLASWWRQAEQSWLQHRTSERRTLLEQLDYMGQLSAQFPTAPWRIVYTKAGNHLTAALVTDSAAVVDHKLYWAPTVSRDEALYLAGVLNANALNELVRPFQSVGAFGPRDFDKYVWRAPIPIFEPNNALHMHLVSLASQGTAAAAAVELPSGEGFQRSRRTIRETLSTSGIAKALDEAVHAVLKSAK
jgi:hypothetical protein